MTEKQQKLKKTDKVEKTARPKKAAKESDPAIPKWKRPFVAATVRTKSLLSRRPHRSFRITRRRDYKRSLKLPGYWGFTNYVRATLWKNKKLFGGLILVYIAATIVISGFGAQDNYSQLSSTLKETSGDLFKGNFGSIAQAGLLLVSTLYTGMSSGSASTDSTTGTTSGTNLSEAQSVIGGLALFFGWLATIWLLRNVLAGHNPRLRDGLYNSGAPVLATVLIGFIVVVQLIPLSGSIIVYSAAQASGLLEGGVAAMLTWIGIILLGMLSLYWITSTFIAMVIVTLPGMYPMRAMRTAGDLVVGRRLRVLFRLLWLALIIILVWAVIMIPIILFDDWIKTLLPVISWLPLVPIMIISMGALTLVYSTSYVYLLYRRIVDDDAAPA